MQNKFYPPLPNCCSLSSLFKFTPPRPPSHSLLLLNRLRSSQWHHNSHTHLRWSYCSLPFIAAPRLFTIRCSSEESNNLSWTCLSFWLRVLIYFRFDSLSAQASNMYAPSHYCLHTNNQASEGFSKDQTQASVIIGSSAVHVIYVTLAGQWKGK